MARAIDADIFIRDLTAMKKMYDAIELDGMIKALKEAPTIEPKQEWISVKDRLPEEGKRVFIYYDDYGATSMTIGLYRNSVYGECWLANMVEISMKSITHWMPLPEPPERDGE